MADVVDGDTSTDLSTDLGACSCAFGCVAGTPTCRTLKPANGFVFGTAQAISPITGQLLFNTTTCLGAHNGKAFVAGTQETGSSGQKACVITVKELKVSSSGVVSSAGSLPLVILVLDRVEIAGLFDVGARGVLPGPGGSLGGIADLNGKPGQGQGAGSTCGCSGAGCGGGGAGHGLAGAAGGARTIHSCSQSSAGGVTWGDASLVSLLGGSGGASGVSAKVTTLGAGGAGGGALQISCAGPMVIEGTINAGGGGGQKGQKGSSIFAGGGGGGSGGAVLLEASRFSGSGLVAVNGGGGGSGGDLCSVVTSGEDGQPSFVAAKGGKGAAECGSGGAGGTGVQAAGAGASLKYAGGGAGGGAGRVRLNWYQSTSTLPIGVSALVTTGEVSAQP